MNAIAQQTLANQDSEMVQCIFRISNQPNGISIIMPTLERIRHSNAGIVNDF